MANVGEQLLQPEAGWKRIEDNDEKLIYLGNWNHINGDYSGGNISYTPDKKAKVKLYVKTNKIRLIYQSGRNYNPTDDSITIDGNNYLINSKQFGVENRYTLVFEKNNLDNTIHEVILNPGTNGAYSITLDAIDISESGYLLTEDEYNKLISFNYLIYDNGTYKNYDATNNKLVEVTDIDSVFTNYTGIKDLNKIIPFIPSFSEGWKIVSNKNFNLKVDALKSTQEMICTLEPLSMKKFKTIHSITGDYTIENNGVIKLLFSFDKGTTWKTYDVNNSEWNDVNVDIPIKLYENFTDEDKTNWDTARDTILSDGISAQDLGNVDFQSVKANKLMFAVAFNRPTYSDTCTLKDLKINYDGLETYIQLACGSDLNKYEAMISITGDSVEVKTASNQNKILVTMTTNI